MFGKGLQQQRGLSNAWVPANENHTTRHHPSPKDPIEFIESHAPARQRRNRYITESLHTHRGGESSTTAGCLWRRGSTPEFERVPCPAAIALALPPGMGLATGLTEKRRLVLGHPSAPGVARDARRHAREQFIGGRAAGSRDLIDP